MLRAALLTFFAKAAAEECSGGLAVDPRVCVGIDASGNLYCQATALEVGDIVPLRVRVQSTATYSAGYVPAMLHQRATLQVALVANECVQLSFGPSCTAVPSSDIFEFVRFEPAAEGAASFEMGPAPGFQGTNNCQEGAWCGHITIEQDTPLEERSRVNLGYVFLRLVKRPALAQSLLVHVAATKGTMETTGGICTPELTADGFGTSQANFAPLELPTPPSPPFPPAPYNCSQLADMVNLGEKFCYTASPSDCERSYYVNKKSGKVRECASGRKGCKGGDYNDCPIPSPAPSPPCPPCPETGIPARRALFAEIYPPEELVSARSPRGECACPSPAAPLKLSNPKLKGQTSDEASAFLRAVTDGDDGTHASTKKLRNVWFSAKALQLKGGAIGWVKVTPRAGITTKEAAALNGLSIYAGRKAGKRNAKCGGPFKDIEAGKPIWAECAAASPKDKYVTLTILGGKWKRVIELAEVSVYRGE